MENAYKLTREANEQKEAADFEQYLDHYFEGEVWAVKSSGRAQVMTGSEILDLLEEKSCDLAAFQEEPIYEKELEEVAEELERPASGKFCGFFRQKIKNLPKGLPEVFYFKIRE